MSLNTIVVQRYRKNGTMSDLQKNNKKRYSRYDQLLNFLEKACYGSECVEWDGARTVDGYGTCWANKKHNRVNRLVLEYKLGRKLVEGEVSCHTCDNSSCYNPDHLFVGTRKDNQQDMVKKGRHVIPGGKRGESSPSCKLSDKQVNEIRMRLKTPYHGIVKDLSIEFGVSDTTVSDIKNNKVRTKQCTAVVGTD